MDNARRKIKRIARFHAVLLFLHPLFGRAGQYIKDFLHRRMKMEPVRFARRQLGADEQEVGVRDHARFAMPVVGFARKFLDFSLVKGNKSPAWQRLIRHERQS